MGSDSIRNEGVSVVVMYTGVRSNSSQFYGTTKVDDVWVGFRRFVGLGWVILVGWIVFDMGIHLCKGFSDLLRMGSR